MLKMRYLRHLFLILSVTVCGNLLAQNNQKDLEQLMFGRGEYFFTLTVSDPTEIQAISDLCSVDDTDGRTVVCFANQNEYEILIEKGYQPHLQTPPSLLETPIMWDGSHREAYDWDAYPTYEAYENMMQQFAAEHPDRCTYFELGTLASGRKLMFCRINNGQPDGKPKFLYTSTMHGNETTGFMLMLRLIDELCSNNDDRILNLVNNLDIFICPNTNPDGTYYGGNQSVSGARRNNANDLDLNRHYPDFDKGPHPDNEWCYQDETLWLMNLARDHKFTMAANFHTGSEVVNYPWDTHPSLHADDEWWKQVCHEYADLCHEQNPDYLNMQHQYAENGIINGYKWYTISGSRQDYMNYFAQCREVTIETSNTYMPDATTMPMYWNYNHNSMLSYMEQCLNGIHGTITDAETGIPIEATVSIIGHDHHGSEVSSHLPAGDYHRVIKGGTYNVTFSAYGYVSQTITITVNDNEAVEQNVQLVPDPNSSTLTADFTISSEMVTTGKPIRFFEKCQGRHITGWAWQFQGGTPTESNERNPYVVYETSGLYDVSLTITDAEGQTSTLTKEQLVDVYASYPIADSEVVLGDCKGLLLPSGGDCGHYGNNENLKMTVRPGDAGKKVCVNFLKFKTQQQSDVLRVYDGTSTAAPLLGTFSGFSIPDSIVANNPEGALTFTFVSDARYTYYGWLATMTCIGGEAAEENVDRNFKVYPNPAQGFFTIETSGEFTYRLYNTLGQCLLSGHGKDATRVETKDLRRGICFLRIESSVGHQVEKLIIEK